MMPSAIFPDLKDRSVLITGGGSGIGAALTEGFIAQGSRVAFIDIAEEASQALVDSLDKQYGNRPFTSKRTFPTSKPCGTRLRKLLITMDQLQFSSITRLGMTGTISTM